jgi:hypothetical protein
MSDTVSSAEIDGQHVELLPARTAMSLFTTQGASPPRGGLGLAVPVMPIMPIGGNPFIAGNEVGASGVR